MEDTGHVIVATTVLMENSNRYGTLEVTTAILQETRQLYDPGVFHLLMGQCTLYKRRFGKKKWK